MGELKRNEDNPKKFWKVIRSVIPSNNADSNNEILLKDGARKLDRCDVAAFINNYFINVGNLHPTPDDDDGDDDDDSVVVDDCDDIDNTTSAECLNSSNNMLGADGTNKCLLTEFRESDIFKITKSINVSKSSGLDNINSAVIKAAFEILTPEVTHMYKLSITNAHFPGDWKKALVIPIPKQGDLTKVQNFRPISLLPLPGKILEKLIHQQLSDFLEKGSLLSDKQHGFRKSHSTTHAIAQVTNYINKKMDARLPTVAVFIDFRKAFDCVQHPVLIQKLNKPGFNMTVINWICSYLSNRQQRVYANETYSSFQDITQGVPQGSVLGPLFYIVYANDLVNKVDNCGIALYADDTVLYTANKDFSESVKKTPGGH